MIHLTHNWWTDEYVKTLSTNGDVSERCLLQLQTQGGVGSLPVVLFDYAVTAQILYFPMYYLLQERAKVLGFFLPELVIKGPRLQIRREWKQSKLWVSATQCASDPKATQIWEIKSITKSGWKGYNPTMFLFYSSFYGLEALLFLNLPSSKIKTKYTREVQLVGPARTLSEAPHQAGNVHWNNAVRNDGRISRLDLASPTSPSAQGWFVDSWSPLLIK